MLVAFDMFGTLADTSGVAGELKLVCGERAVDVARVWRARQLEYMFRVAAMGQFPTFAELTSWGLIGALHELDIPLPAADRVEQLVGGYRRLRPFDDVVPALVGLRARQHGIVVFSVGPRAWLEDLVAAYTELVDDIISAEDAGVYKPHPGIYRHLLAHTGVGASGVVVVSSNPFDIIGAGTAGLQTAWCCRNPQAIFDPWGPRPDHIVANLVELAEVLDSVAGSGESV
jgi:2-haloacid dehalogenase